MIRTRFELGLRELLGGVGVWRRRFPCDGEEGLDVRKMKGGGGSRVG